MGSLAEDELAKMEIQELYTFEDFLACPEIRKLMQERHEEKMQELCPRLEACAVKIQSTAAPNILENARSGAFEGSIAGIVMSHVRQTYPEEVVMEDPLQSLRWLRQLREQRLGQASGR